MVLFVKPTLSLVILYICIYDIENRILGCHLTCENRNLNSCTSLDKHFCWVYVLDRQNGLWQAWHPSIFALIRHVRKVSFKSIKKLLSHWLGEGNVIFIVKSYNLFLYILMNEWRKQKIINHKKWVDIAYAIYVRGSRKIMIVRMLPLFFMLAN